MADTTQEHIAQQTGARAATDAALDATRAAAEARAAANGAQAAIERVEKRMDQRMDRMEQRMDRMEQRMDRMEQRMDEKFFAQDQRFDAGFREMRGFLWRLAAGVLVITLGATWGGVAWYGKQTLPARAAVAQPSGIMVTVVLQGAPVAAATAQTSGDTALATPPPSAAQ